MSESLCACGCKRPLEGMRTDAIWASRACAVGWARENPGKSLYDARRANRARTKGESGKQMNPRRALKGAAVMLSTFAEAVGHPMDDDLADMAARLFLDKAYPERQRERLGSSTARERKAA